MRRIHPGWKKEFRLDSNDLGFICAGVNFVGDYKWHALFYLSCCVCNKLTTVWAPTKKLLFSWQFSGPYGVTKYGSGWRKDVVNQCLEFDVNTDSEWHHAWPQYLFDNVLHSLSALDRLSWWIVGEHRHPVGSSLRGVFMPYYRLLILKSKFHRFRI